MRNSKTGSLRASPLAGPTAVPSGSLRASPLEPSSTAVPLGSLRASPLAGPTAVPSGSLRASPLAGPTAVPSGSVLAIVLVMMFVLFFIGLAIATVLLVGVRLTGLDKTRTTGLYLAEAGIERTLWKLSDDVDWNDGTPPDNLYTDEPLGEGSYTVTLSERSKSRLRITATGKVGMTEEKILTESIRVITTTAAWWHLDYNYRRVITITNTATTTLSSGYSITFQLDTASLVSANKMQSNGADLRIVYWNGNSFQELDRDVININSPATEIWFATIQAINAGSSNSNYFIYYGNSGAVSPPQNKDKVYYFQDDFNRPNAASLGNKWQNPVGLSTVAVQNNQASLVSIGTDSYIIAVMKPLTNCIITYQVYISAKNRDGSFIFRSESDRLPTYLNQTRTKKNSGQFFYRLTNTWGAIGTRWTPRRRQWYRIKLIILDTSLQCYVNNILRLNNTDTRITRGGQIGFYMRVANSRAYYDDVIVRRYQVPEPTVSAAPEGNITQFTQPKTYYQTR